jgi:drug/metabolite transporter (DMT)-like permease
MQILGLILMSVALSGTGQILLRAGLRGVPPVSASELLTVSHWLDLFKLWQVGVGLLLWCLATLLWLIVLNRAELSYAYCLGSLNYIVVPLAGHYFFRESVNGVRLVGMGFIFLGVLLTVYGSAQS